MSRNFDESGINFLSQTILQLINLICLLRKKIEINYDYNRSDNRILLIVL